MGGLGVGGPRMLCVNRFLPRTEHLLVRSCAWRSGKAAHSTQCNDKFINRFLPHGKTFVFFNKTIMWQEAIYEFVYKSPVTCRLPYSVFVSCKAEVARSDIQPRAKQHTEEQSRAQPPPFLNVTTTSKIALVKIAFWPPRLSPQSTNLSPIVGRTQRNLQR